MLLLWKDDLECTLYRQLVFIHYFLWSVDVDVNRLKCVDRLLALFLGLRYGRAVTLCRIRAIICLLWFIAVSCTFVMFYGSYYVFLTTITTAIVLSLVISLVSYSKIFLRLRQHQLCVQENAHDGQPNGGRIPLNIALYKKTVVSIAMVQVALFVCYVPSIISLNHTTEWSWQ